jgi:general secretion pathway protein K
MHRKPPSRNPTQQRGIAILTVLVIIALVVTLATLILTRQSRAVRQTDNYQSLERAWQYAFALEQYVGMELSRDANTNKYDALTEDWAKPSLLALPDGGDKAEFKGGLEDLQGRFNLNNVLDDKGKLRTTGEGEQLKKLVQQDGLPDGFADAIVDWMDADNIIISGESAENDYYLSTPMPYRAANRAFADDSEIRLLRLEIPDPEQKETMLNQFVQHLTVLPVGRAATKVNANTASDAVLLAVGLTQTQVDKIKDTRKETPYKTTADLFSALGLEDADPKAAALKSLLDVSSQYFRLKGTVSFGRARVFINSVFFRETGKPIRVIMRQLERVDPPQKPTTPTTDDADNTPPIS